MVGFPPGSTGHSPRTSQQESAPWYPWGRVRGRVRVRVRVTVEVRVRVGIRVRRRVQARGRHDLGGEVGDLLLKARQVSELRRDVRLGVGVVLYVGIQDGL